MKHEHIVRSVEQGGIAWEMGIEPGDKLLAINGTEIEDVFDYHYLVNDEEASCTDRKDKRGTVGAGD